MPTFQLTSHKASRTLRGLHDSILWACEYALRLGECRPELIIGEVQRVLTALRKQWGDPPVDRHKAIDMPPLVRPPER